MIFLIQVCVCVILVILLFNVKEHQRGPGLKLGFAVEETLDEYLIGLQHKNR